MKNYYFTMLLLIPTLLTAMEEETTLSLEKPKFFSNDLKFITKLVKNYDIARYGYFTPLTNEEIDNISDMKLHMFFWPAYVKSIKTYMIKSNEESIGFTVLNKLKILDRLDKNMQEEYDKLNLDNALMLDVIIDPEFWDQNYEGNVINTMITETQYTHAKQYQSIVMNAHPDDIRTNEFIQNADFVFLEQVPQTHPLIGKEGLINLYIKQLFEE